MKTTCRLTTILTMLLIALCTSVGAQDSDLCQTVEGVKGTSVSTDPNGNVYVIDGSTLYKLVQNGSEWVKSQYSNFQLGDITSIDVDNPLKIMLFYKDEGIVLFLDEKLSPLMEPLNLMDAQLNHISLATYSTDNTIWLYDVVLHDLINVNFQLKELSRNHLSLENFEPTQLVSLQEKQLAMVNPASGVALFDAFGTYLKTIPVKSDTEWYQVDGEKIYSQRNESIGLGEEKSWSLWSYDYKLLHEQFYELSACGYFESFTYSNGLLWGIDKQHHLKVTIPIPAE